MRKQKSARRNFPPFVFLCAFVPLCPGGQNKAVDLGKYKALTAMADSFIIILE